MQGDLSCSRPVVSSTAHAGRDGTPRREPNRAGPLEIKVRTRASALDGWARVCCITLVGPRTTPREAHMVVLLWILGTTTTIALAYLLLMLGMICMQARGHFGDWEA
jgi:hypothetical protein